MSCVLEQTTDESLKTVRQEECQALDKRICQFCERPLPWYRRVIGQIHCSEACQASERFQLSKIAEALGRN